MSNRYKEALAIRLGACNPSAIAISIVEACAEIRAEPGHNRTVQITADPAVRLMVHQLAYICDACSLEDLSEYGAAVAACLAAIDRERN